MKDYKLLPFRFERFNTDEYLITNEVGEFVFIPNTTFMQFVNYSLQKSDHYYNELKSIQVVYDKSTDLDSVLDMIAVKYRTKKSILNDFTSLHMVVPTLRCNASCIYCQVSRKDIDDTGTEMTKETAKKIVRTIFKSPSKSIKLEFQGGDPSTYFKMVKYIIEEAKWVNLFKRKQLEFVICTNITLLTSSMIRYLKKNKCYISTSLDGPEDLHNKNRPLQNGTQTHQMFEQKLELIRSIMKEEDSVSALMTTSSYSLGRFKEIIDEYVRLKFNCIFLRALNPYGFAKKNKSKIAYSTDLFIKNYKDGLDYIIELNKKGVFIIEGFAELLLKRILTPFATGFVDLQSPAGVGISGVIYDYDGNTYVSDEARMMARFNDHYFKIGNVHSESYLEMFNGNHLHNIISNSCIESLPGCATCVYQPYCGADPVRNFSEQGDMIGHRPSNETCKKNKEIIKYIFELYRKDDIEIKKVFWSWINKQS